METNWRIEPWCRWQRRYERKSIDVYQVLTVNQVFGADLIIVELDETFGSLADKMSSQSPSPSDDPASLLPLHEKSLPQVTVDEEEDDIVDTLVARASIILEAHGALYNTGFTSVRPVCITQPHHSKKEIMFTTFIFSLAIARANDIDFLWSSDSDSWVFPGTLDTAIKSIYSDARIGGTATRFSIHNDSASTIATLVAATYEADFALQIGVLSSCNTTDCQPGPCALFRVSALTPILLPWYNQRILGHRPVRPLPPAPSPAPQLTSTPANKRRPPPHHPPPPDLPRRNLAPPRPNRNRHPNDHLKLHPPTDPLGPRLLPRSSLLPAHLPHAPPPPLPRHLPPLLPPSAQHLARHPLPHLRAERGLLLASGRGAPSGDGGGVQRL